VLVSSRGLFSSERELSVQIFTLFGRLFAVVAIMRIIFINRAGPTSARVTRTREARSVFPRFARVAFVLGSNDRQRAAFAG